MTTQALFQLTKTTTDFPRVKITSSKIAYDVIRQYYSDDIEIYESFFILLVDRANTTVGYAKISQGGIAGTVVDVKILAKYCLDSLCSGVILAHNHPSGNLRPSTQDEDITKKVVSALQLIDVNVLDHLILTSNSYYSFKDERNIL
jgi:DNA repair protein RadC